MKLFLSQDIKAWCVDEFARSVKSPEAILIPDGIYVSEYSLGVKNRFI